MLDLVGVLEQDSKFWGILVRVIPAREVAVHSYLAFAIEICRGIQDPVVFLTNSVGAVLLDADLLYLYPHGQG